MRVIYDPQNGPAVPDGRAAATVNAAIAAGVQEIETGTLLVVDHARLARKQGRILDLVVVDMGHENIITPEGRYTSVPYSDRYYMDVLSLLLES